MVKSAAVFFIGALLLGGYASGDDVPVAVLDFTVAGQPESYGVLAAAEVRIELLKEPKIRLVNREQLTTILKEHALTQAGLVENSGKISEIGSAAGARFFITGTIGKMGGMTALYVKCIDVASITNAKEVARKGDFSERDILRQVRDATRELLGDIASSGGANAPSSAPAPKGYVFFSGGEFFMGDSTGNDDEAPVHRVKVNGFYLKANEVTLGEYLDFCKSASYAAPQRPEGAADNLPVTWISWVDANAYCEWYSDEHGVTMRLPTEAEWEFACRKGLKLPKFQKEKFDKKFAWYADNSGNTLHPVASHACDGSGVYDLVGNVNEWCQDWYAADYYQSGDYTNPHGPDKGTYRVARGGCAWSTAKELSACARGSKFPDYKFNNVGFRPVILPAKK